MKAELNTYKVEESNLYKGNVKMHKNLIYAYSLGLISSLVVIFFQNLTY